MKPLDLVVRKFSSFRKNFPQIAKNQIPRIPQIVLGMLFLGMGLNHFFNFAHVPTPPVANSFWVGLGSSGYLIPLLKATEIFAGTLLIVNRFTNLSAVLLAPIVVNILMYHMFLDPASISTALVVALLYIHLLFNKRGDLAILLRK